MAAYDLEALLTGGDLGNMGSAVAAAVEKHREAAKERLADQLVVVIDQADRQVTRQVANVKQIRQSEKNALKELEKISRTVEYLRETGNPLPYFKAIGSEYDGQDFCGVVGVAVPESDDPLWSVPKDFAPAS